MKINAGPYIKWRAYENGQNCKTTYNKATNATSCSCTGNGYFTVFNFMDQMVNINFFLFSLILWNLSENIKLLRAQNKGKNLFKLIINAVDLVLVSLDHTLTLFVQLIIQPVSALVALPCDWNVALLAT